MKSFISKALLALIIINCSLFSMKAQSWAELWDSTKYYHKMQDLESAIKWAKLALSQAEKEFGKLDTNYAKTQLKVAQLFYFTGKLDSAVIYQESNLKLCRILFPGDYPQLAMSINTMAQIYNSTGRFSEAEILYKEALEIVKKVFKGDNPTTASAISNLAAFYQIAGKYNDSELLYKEALQMQRRLFKGDHFDLATSINNLATLYYNTYNYKEAESLLTEAYEMQRRLYKGDNSSLAQSINNMALFYYKSGNYTKAEPLFNEAYEMRKRLFKSDHPDIANSITSIGTFNKAKGNYSLAESLFLQAKEMLMRIYGIDNPILGEFFSDLGGLYLSMKKYPEAETYLKEALKLNKRILKVDHFSLARNMNDLAICYYYLHNYGEFETLLNEAYEMYNRISKSDNVHLATCKSNLAFYYTSNGNYAKADSLYKEALEMIRKIFKGDHIKVARCINNLAGSYKDHGRLRDAEPLFLESYNMTKRLAYRYFPYLNEKAKFDYWNTQKGIINDIYKFALDYYPQKPEILSQLYDINLATKGLVINSQEKALQNARSLERTIENWRSTREKWVNLFQNPDKAKRMGIDIDSLEKVALSYETQISAASPQFRRYIDTTSITWRDVQNKLKPGEAAVEILQFINLRKAKKDTSIVYLALIIKNNTKENPEIVIMDTTNELESESIIKYQSLMDASKKNSKNSYVKSSNKSINDELKKLYNVFWKKINDKLEGISKVYLSPDGVYNKVNPNILINPETDKYLIEEKKICFLTNSKNLVEVERYKTESQATTQATLIGNPNFDLPKKFIKSDSPKENFELNRALSFLPSKKIASLPGTESEVKDITKDLEANKWQVNDYLGAQALESMVKKLKNPRILHLATHGVFLKDVEMIKELDMQEDRKEKYVENPLLRSMLLFAGAQNTIRGETISGDDDGILTAYEIMNLDLDNTELVVLSACNTGLGEVRNGEGVFGLQRAFQMAGAKAIIMSLWSVNDYATKELMTTFYDKWLSGKSKGDAFREAQLALKDKYKDFYYWGGFIMVGE